MYLNRSTDPLFNLVHSLSKAEKRHFNLFAQRHVKDGIKNDYLKLFYILEKRMSYNEGIIKKEIVRNGLEKRIDKSRSYLFNAILKSLTAFHAGNSQETGISSLINGIRILYSKGLYKESAGLVKRVKKIAKKNESFSLLLELLDIEDEKINKSLEEEKCINMERTAIINKIKNLNEIAKLRVQLKENIFDNLSLRSSIKEKDLNSLIAPLELKKNSPISTKAKIEYHNIKGAYYFKIKNYEKALAQMKMKLNCIEHFPLTNLSILRKYFGTINNIITAQSALSLFNDVTISIEKLNKLMVNGVVIKNIPFQKMIILQQLLFRIKLHVAKAELEEALQLVPEIESTLKKYQGSISIEVKSTFYIYVGYIYFMAGDFKKALVWMNRLENEIGSSTRQDIQTLCRLQLMIIYYELGHDELVGYLQRATSHNLIKKGEMYKTEAAILGFFKKEPVNSNSQKELTTIFRKLKVRITALLIDPFEANILNSLDIISWIDSKIENRRLIEVLKEKAKLIGS